MELLPSSGPFSLSKAMLRAIGIKHLGRRMQSTAAAAKTAQLASELTWTDFFALRKQQRRIGTVGSVVAALGTMAGTFGYVSNIAIDPTETLFGLDIFTCYIGGIMCMGFVGFMFGPGLIGDPMFALVNRAKMPAFSAKQKLFLKHIQKMRVDASRQSMNNPVPDYYGEKIGSLKDYRQWLRDCNEYRRKAKAFL